MVFGGSDFAGVFAQLGRDEIQLEFRINLFFGAPGHALFTLQSSQGIFVERKSHVIGAPAQGHVVLFRPGKIKQGSAEVFFFEHSNVDLQSILQREADLVFSVRQRLIDAGKCKDVLGERVHVLLRRVAIGKGDKQIEIAHGLFAPSQRARRRNGCDRLSRLFNV